MSYELYVPRPGYSVRPRDLTREEREALHGEETVPLDAVPRPPLRPEFPLVTPAPASAAHARPEGDAGPGRRPSRLRRAGGVSLFVAGAVVVAVALKAFVLQAFVIPSDSMRPALHAGDRVLVDKVSYRLGEPVRGDVVVIRRRPADAERGLGQALRTFAEGIGLLRPSEDGDLIKRIIGLPGETVRIRDGVVLVDGRALREEDVVPDGRSFPARTVPPDSYYVLGDNRRVSDDSRFALGSVAADDVVGRAVMVLWPPANASTLRRSHYAGGDPTDEPDDVPPDISPTGLPQYDDAPEAPPS